METPLASLSFPLVRKSPWPPGHTGASPGASIPWPKEAPAKGARVQVAAPALDGYLVEGVVNGYVADDTEAAVATVRQRQGIIAGYPQQSLQWLCTRPNRPKLVSSNTGNRMKTLTGMDAKYGFGRLIDLACAEPVAAAKHRRPVVVVMAVEEFERLKALDTTNLERADKRQVGRK